VFNGAKRVTLEVRKGSIAVGSRRKMGVVPYGGVRCSIPRTDVLGIPQSSLRDWGCWQRIPSTACWAKFSRPFGTGPEGRCTTGPGLSQGESPPKEKSYRRGNSEDEQEDRELVGYGVACFGYSIP
jgi:hypothetical protein